MHSNAADGRARLRVVRRSAFRSEDLFAHGTKHTVVVIHGPFALLLDPGLVFFWF